MKSIKNLLVFAAMSVTAIASVACGSAIGLATGAGEVVTNEDELQSILIEIDQRHTEEVQNLHQEMNEARDVITQMLDKLNGISPDIMMPDNTSTTGIILQDESTMIVHPQYSEVMDIGNAYLSGLDQNESQQAFSQETNALKDRLMQILMEPKETELERIQRLEIDGLQTELALLDQHIQELYQEIDEMHFDSGMDEFEKEELKGLGEESEKMIHVMQQIIGANPEALSNALQADTKEAREARNQIILANDEVVNPNFKEAVEDLLYDKNIDKEDAKELTKMITESSVETAAGVSATSSKNCIESGKSKIACEALAKNAYRAAGITNEETIAQQIIIDAAVDKVSSELSECVSSAQGDPSISDVATKTCMTKAEKTFKTISPIVIDEPQIGKFIESTKNAAVEAHKSYDKSGNNFDTKDDFVKNAAKEAMVAGVTGNKDFVSMIEEGRQDDVSDKIRACMKSNGFDPGARKECSDKAFGDFSAMGGQQPMDQIMENGKVKPSDNYGMEKNEAQQSVTDIVQEMKDGKLTEKQFNDKLDKAINIKQ